MQTFAHLRHLRKSGAASPATLPAPPAASPTLLLASSQWWPLAAKLAVALRHNGCTLDVVCPDGHPLRTLTGLRTVFPYRRSRSLRCLELAIRRSAPQRIIPCDDGVVWQLHALHARHPDLRDLIEASLGDPAAFPTVRSRPALLALAAKLGLSVPETTTLEREQDLVSFLATHSFPVVLKLDGTWGGNGVRIVHSATEAMQAWHSLRESPPLPATIKRALVDREALALWLWQTRTPPVITAQQYIRGNPANVMLLADRGNLVAYIAVEVLSSQGATGAATVVRLIDHAEITRAARSLTRALGLSGFHGLDFVLESSTGRACLLELNPRCTQLGHLARPGQPSLAATLYSRLAGAAPASPEPVLSGDHVAFFPQALRWPATDPDLREVPHDFAYPEPALTRELLLDHWPHRQPLARLYHRLRPQQTVSVSPVFVPPAPDRTEGTAAP